jgi:hypothetical protein
MYLPFQAQCLYNADTSKKKDKASEDMLVHCTAWEVPFMTTEFTVPSGVEI